MKILFVHQNFPGQYRAVAPSLQSEGHEVMAISCRKEAKIAGIRNICYELKRGNAKNVHPWLINSETAVIRGEAVARVAKQLRAQGWEPDVVVGHAGWGEMMFLRTALPNSRIVSFCEYWYKGEGADANFDREFPNAPDAAERCAVRNMHLSLSLLGSDIGMAPTEWQASLFPDELRTRIAVNHDGIETDKLTPDDSAWIRLARESGKKGEEDRGLYRKGDEVVTFVNRNLEPMRGYHQFMRALPHMMERRPKARFVIVGGDKVSYGAPPPGRQGYKEIFLKEVEGRIDRSRIHFVNQVPYSTLVSLLRVSAAHVYFTYPFVLSWSMLEAMSLEALVIGSDTPPVSEVIEHGKNGLLTDFFSPEKLAGTVCDVLERPKDYIDLRREARRTVVERYDYQTVCLPRHRQLMGLR